MKKSAKKKKKALVRLISLITVVIGVGLILFSLLTPALKTYKGENISYKFGFKNVSEITTIGTLTNENELPWRVKKDDDKNYVEVERDALIISSYIKVGEFKGLSIVVSEDTVYKSTGALVYLIVGASLCAVGAAVCTVSFVSKGKKK